MPSIPVPDEAIPFIFKRNQDEWRGFDTTRSNQLVTHKNINRGEFVCLATDGIMVVIRDLTGRYDHMHLENIEWPKLELEKAPRVSKPKAPSQLEFKQNQLDKILDLIASL